MSLTAAARIIAPTTSLQHLATAAKKFIEVLEVCSEVLAYTSRGEEQVLGFASLMKSGKQ
jgi:hypothetical protein